MTRLFALLALVVAFSGTPLRLAEAADDLARSLEGPEAVGEVEPVDGCVGDDSGETLRADVAYDSADAPTPCDLVAPFAPLLTGRSPGRLGMAVLPLPQRPSGSTRRHALLERFLC